MEAETLALDTRGSKQTPAAPAEEFAAGNKPEAAEEAKSSSAGAGKKKKKTKLVQASQEYINILLAHPPNLTLSHRLRSFTEETCPFTLMDPELGRAVLEYYPILADQIDKWNESKQDILRQYQETGCAYEKIEVDDEDN